MRIRSFSAAGARSDNVTNIAWFPILGPIALALCATVLWGISLEGIDVRRMTDVGLISVLPPAVFIALLILTISFCLILHQRQFHRPVLLLHIVVLVVMLYGTGTLVEITQGFAFTWRHVGITESITRSGSINPKIDAYFNWPGFFILSAFITEIAGLQSAISLAAWASVFFNLLYLGPLLMIMRSATSDKRAIWLGVWFFYLTNWIGQDYLAPQALSYFLHLTILAILLRWFKGAATASSSLHKILQSYPLPSRLAKSV